MAKKNLEVIGKWAFLIGLVIAIVAGLIEGYYTIPYASLILVILGLIVGFLNITEKDTVKLLVAIIALMGVGAATVIVIGEVITTINTILLALVTNILVFAGAAGLVVAVKAIYEVGKK